MPITCIPDLRYKNWQNRGGILPPNWRKLKREKSKLHPLEGWKIMELLGRKENYYAVITNVFF